MKGRPIGVFDSGIGGLCVLRACRTLLPHERFIYLADKANMPYGTKCAKAIAMAAFYCAQTLAAMNCKAIVVACNTATETAIDVLRRLFPSMIFVGLEPAVRPCLSELGPGGYALALVTSATASSPRFLRLVGGDRRVALLPQPELAGLIEKSAGDTEAIRPYIYRALRPYGDAESVILGCSHYTHIAPLISEFYGGKIKIYDGAAGAAARLKYCLSAADMLAPERGAGAVSFYSTVTDFARFRG